MARLPDPITEGIETTWPEDWAMKEKSFYNILGQAVRKAINAEKLKAEEKEKKD